MKKILFAAALLAAACTTQVPDNQCQVEIDMENMPDTVYMLYAKSDGSGVDKCDTLVASNGKLSHTVTLDEACMVLLRSNDNTPSNMEALGSANPMNITLYLLPGNKLVLTGDVAAGTHEMGGSEAYKQLQEGARIMAEAEDKAGTLNKEYVSRLKVGETPDSVQAYLLAKYETIMDEYKQAVAEYIEANPSSLGAVLLLTKMDTENFEKYDAVVTEEVKQGALAVFYDKAKKNYEKELARRAAKEALGEGAEAPDFTLPTIDGGTLALSSLRGKYVIIDFWGSWCGWCIKGMPDMKKYYEKYAGKLEILGVDCGDTDDKWKAAVEKHELPWKHVKNGKDDEDITTMYAIEGYPTKLIIDPEGKIVKYIVGEDPAFYTALDEVLGK